MDLIPFEFESRQVRALTGGDGESWFMATDVCKALSIKNIAQEMAELEEDELSTLDMFGRGKVDIVNELGLYSLILSSCEPKAKKFIHWIVHEVVPSVCKTGGYGILAADMSETHRRDIAQTLRAMTRAKDPLHIAQLAEALYWLTGRRFTHLLPGKIKEQS